MPDNSFTGKRLIIADADPSALWSLKRTLEEKQYEVIAAVYDGCHAIQSAFRLRPDAVLLDHDVPKMEAVEVAFHLSQEQIAPVILFGGKLTAEQSRELPHAGVQAYLTKPLNAASLFPAIEIALNVWKREQAEARRLETLQAREEARDTVERAKRLLMDTYKLSEPKAYRLLQRKSMDVRRSMREVADAVLLSFSVTGTPVSPHS
jgi:two-component system, response regulator PdtaR